MNTGDLLQWSVVALILYIFYRKVIAPFAKRMMEIPVDEKPEPMQRIVFDDDEIEDNSANTADMRRKIEQRLKLSDADQMEKLKYETLLEKLRGQSEKAPDEVGNVITNLAHGLENYDTQTPKGKKRGSA